MKKVTAEGKTVEEAIAAGLKELGLPREQVEVRVLEEPGRRLLGWFGKRTAKVELVWRADPVSEARRFLLDVIRWMGVPAELEVVETEDRLRIHLVGEQLGLYIGRRGETLQALQYLASLVANRYAEHYLPVELDAGDYRRRRVESLQQMARRLADKAVRTGRPVSLEPMSAWERRCIHTALSGHLRVYTESHGEGRLRHVIIFPKSAAGSSAGFSRPSSSAADSSLLNRPKGERRSHPQNVRRWKDRQS